MILSLVKRSSTYLFSESQQIVQEMKSKHYPVILKPLPLEPLSTYKPI